MRSLLCAFVVLFTLAAPCVHAQKKAPPATPPFRIRLPEYADTKNLEIHYKLTGSFGGYGGVVRAKAEVWEYEIETSHASRPARSLKVVVYCPGFQVETLDIPSLDADAAERGADLSLKPAATVPLSGTVSLPEGMKAEDVVVDVSFTAFWECEFFGRADCLVPSYKRVASASPAGGGAFTVELPDFAHDPVVSAHEYPGDFTLAVSERKSGKLLFMLKPKETTGQFNGLPVASSYTDGQEFVPQS